MKKRTKKWSSCEISIVQAYEDYSLDTILYVLLFCGFNRSMYELCGKLHQMDIIADKEYEDTRKYGDDDSYLTSITRYEQEWAHEQILSQLKETTKQ